MEVQLQELLDKIRSDGLEAAEEEAKAIIGRAEKKSEEIIIAAKKEAAQLLEEAKREAEKMEISGKEALKQAGRDLILTMNKKLVQTFSAVVEEEVAKVLKGDLLAQAITSLFSSWKIDKSEEITLLLPSQEWDSLEQVLRNKLSEKIKNGLEIKPGKTITSGFKVILKNGSAYYDFTDAALAEVLCEYLNPRLSELLVKAVEKKG